MNKHLKSIFDALRSTHYPDDVLCIICEYISDFDRIAIGKKFTVVIKNNGTLHSWGTDEHGEISGTPKESGFISVSAGVYHCTALRDDGTLHSWGQNDCKQYIPKESGFIAISAGSYCSIALRDDGTLHAWGYDASNQISNTPIESGFVEVFAEGSHYVAVKDDGTLRLWGQVGVVVSIYPGFDLLNGSICLGFDRLIILQNNKTVICYNIGVEKLIGLETVSYNF